MSERKAQRESHAASAPHPRGAGEADKHGRNKTLRKPCAHWRSDNQRDRRGFVHDRTCRPVTRRGESFPVSADELREAVERPWLEEGRIEDGRRTLGELLERAGDDAPAEARARALTAAGVLAFRAGDTDAARVSHTKALELARLVGDHEAEASALGGLARVALRAGDLDNTRRHAEAAVAIWRELGDEQSLARQLHLLPYIDYMQGNDDAARRGFEESLELARRVGEDQLVVGELTNLGSVETRAGNLDRALSLCREALTLARDLWNAYVLPYCVVNVGGVASVRGDHEDAARILGAGKAMFDRSGAAIDPGTAIEFDRHVERTRAALGGRFPSAWDGGYALDDEGAVAAALAYEP
jgi:tetratricopeptide (TPR) repeat protein